MWSMGVASELLSGLAEASALDTIGFEAAGSEGGFDGLEDLGELVLIAGAILLTAQVFKTIGRIGKFWRERHFRRYQAEFKRHMEGMTELFFSRLATVAAQQGDALYSKMREKLTRQIEDLLRGVCRYARSGRADMAGVHLYINKELAFLPSQLPEKQVTEIHTTLRLLLHEVDGLRKASKGA